MGHICPMSHSHVGHCKPLLLMGVLSLLFIFTLEQFIDHHSKLSTFLMKESQNRLFLTAIRSSTELYTPYRSPYHNTAYTSHIP